jgi:hypothetical protein
MKKKTNSESSCLRDMGNAGRNRSCRFLPDYVSEVVDYVSEVVSY